MEMPHSQWGYFGEEKNLLLAAVQHVPRSLHWLSYLISVHNIQALKECMLYAVLLVWISVFYWPKCLSKLTWHSITVLFTPCRQMPALPSASFPVQYSLIIISLMLSKWGAMWQHSGIRYCDSLQCERLPACRCHGELFVARLGIHNDLCLPLQ